MPSASDQAIASACKLSASSSLTDTSDQVAPMYFMKQLSANGHQFSSLVDTNQQKSVSFPQLPQGMASSKHSLLVGRNSDSFPGDVISRPADRCVCVCVIYLLWGSCPHKRIITITTVYIARNNIHVEIIQFHTN